MRLKDVVFADESFRIDAEYFKRNYLAYLYMIHSRGSVKLGDVCHFMIGPFGSAYDTSNYVQKSDYRYIRGQDVKPFFLTDSESRFMTEQDFIRLQKYALQEDDLLVSVVGTLGNACIIYKDELPAIFSCKSTAIRANVINAYFLLAYLNSKYGRELLLRKERGAIQMGLNLDDLRSLDIPQFTDSFYSHIEVLIKSAHDKISEANGAYHDTEQSLLSELGFASWTPTEESVSVKNCSDFMSAGRFDAEYFQPKYDDYFNMITKYRNGHKRLGDLTIQNTTQCDKTVSDYDYIEIGDVDVGNATYCSTHLSVDDLPANAKIMAHKGDLIISKVRPNRGAVAIIEDDRSDLVVSGAFTVVAPKDEIFCECLLVLLRTNVYRDWLLRWAVGSSYPVVKDEDVLNMPIPLFDKDIQQTISAKVRESFALRAESKRLLDLAKHAVETAIEQGEEKAMEILEVL